MAMSRSMVQDMHKSKTLECHSPGNCEIGAKVCGLLGNCNSNGICSEGICTCNEGFFGADCSVTMQPFDIEKEITLQEFNWLNFKLVDELDIPTNQYLYLEGKYEVYTHESKLPSK